MKRELGKAEGKQYSEAIWESIWKSRYPEPLALILMTQDPVRELTWLILGFMFIEPG